MLGYSLLFQVFLASGQVYTANVVHFNSIEQCENQAHRYHAGLVETKVPVVGSNVLYTRHLCTPVPVEVPSDENGNPL